MSGAKWVGCSNISWNKRPKCRCTCFQAGLEVQWNIKKTTLETKNYIFHCKVKCVLWCLCAHTKKTKHIIILQPAIVADLQSRFLLIFLDWFRWRLFSGISRIFHWLLPPHCGLISSKTGKISQCRRWHEGWEWESGSWRPGPDCEREAVLRRFVKVIQAASPPMRVIDRRPAIWVKRLWI